MELLQPKQSWKTETVEILRYVFMSLSDTFISQDPATILRIWLHILFHKVSELGLFIDNIVPTAAEQS